VKISGRCDRFYCIIYRCIPEQIHTSLYRYIDILYRLITMHFHTVSVQLIPNSSISFLKWILNFKYNNKSIPSPRKATTGLNRLTTDYSSLVARWSHRHTCRLQSALIQPDVISGNPVGTMSDGITVGSSVHGSPDRP